MTLRKYGLIAITIALIAVLAAACGDAETPSAPEPGIQGREAMAENPPAPAPSAHPLSVPGLRARDYSAGKVTLLDEVPTEEGLEAREFTFESEGHAIYGLIEKPSGPAPEGGWPVILLAHGYIHPDRYSTTESYKMVSRYYARGGFLVVKPDLRGHGRSEGHSDMTATWIFDYTVDVLNLLEGLDGIPGADTENVFLYGHSMGGEIALRMMMVDQESIKGSTLWAAMSEDFPENLMFYVGGTPEGRQAYQDTLDEEFSREEYESLSLSPYVGSIETPMIIHHGTADVEVPLEWTTSLLEMLDEEGIAYDYHDYPGEDHNLSGSFYRVMDADMEFFRNLID